MKVIHRVSISKRQDKKVLKKLAKLGIEPFVEGGRIFSNMRYFDIPEDESVWPQVNKIIEKSKILDIPRAEFRSEEILSSEWVRIYPSYFIGEDYSFPEPHLDDSWKKLSFDYKNQCPQCGVGLRQKAPIHLKGEPELKNNDFMGIFWTYDIFARNEIFEVLLKKCVTGFESYPAIYYEKNEPLKTIKQLKVTCELVPGIIDDNLTRESYSCGHVKYHVPTRDMCKFSRNIFEDMPDFVRTSEWFGSGHLAIQSILASSKFVRLYYEKNWQGLSFAPIQMI